MCSSIPSGFLYAIKDKYGDYWGREIITPSLYGCGENGKILVREDFRRKQTVKQALEDFQAELAWIARKTPSQKSQMSFFAFVEVKNIFKKATAGQRLDSIPFGEHEKTEIAIRIYPCAKIELSQVLEKPDFSEVSLSTELLKLHDGLHFNDKSLLEIIKKLDEYTERFRKIFIKDTFRRKYHPGHVYTNRAARFLHGNKRLEILSSYIDEEEDWCFSDYECDEGIAFEFNPKRGTCDIVDIWGAFPGLILVMDSALEKLES